MSDMNPPPRRSATEVTTATSSGRSIFRRFSFKDQAEQPSPPPKPNLKEAYYPTYKLSWEKLKAYLERKFPEVAFGEREVSLHLCS